METWILNLAVTTGETVKASPLMIKRQTAAHGRYLRSLKTLAQIEQAERRPQRMTVTVAPVANPNESIFTTLTRDVHGVFSRRSSASHQFT